jgi:hypothetical protein
MKARWQFLIECKGFQFDRVYEFEGTLTHEQTEALGLPCGDLLITIKPEADMGTVGVNQFCKMQILIHGSVEQTKDLACWVAVNASEYISFFHGELKVHSGLLMAERIPETSEEEEMLGDNRWFAEAHLVEVRPTPTFDGASFNKIAADQTVNAAIRHFNAAVKANNPIDQFLGLFRILEDFYSPAHKYLKEALKRSSEPLKVACQYITYTENGNTGYLTESDYYQLVDKLVETRHQCAHLKTKEGFGIPHGDLRVDNEVTPLIPPLRRLTFEIIRKRLEKAN